MKRKTIFTSVMALLFAGSAMAQTNATEIKSGGFYRLYSAEKGKTLYADDTNNGVSINQPKEGDNTDVFQFTASNGNYTIKSIGTSNYLNGFTSGKKFNISQDKNWVTLSGSSQEFQVKKNENARADADKNRWIIGETSAGITEDKWFNVNTDKGITKGGINRWKVDQGTIDDKASYFELYPLTEYTVNVTGAEEGATVDVTVTDGSRKSTTIVDKVYLETTPTESTTCTVSDGYTVKSVSVSDKTITVEVNKNNFIYYAPSTKIAIKAGNYYITQKNQGTNIYYAGFLDKNLRSVAGYSSKSGDDLPKMNWSFAITPVNEQDESQGVKITTTDGYLCSQGYVKVGTTEEADVLYLIKETAEATTFAITSDKQNYWKSGEDYGYGNGVNYIKTSTTPDYSFTLEDVVLKYYDGTTSSSESYTFETSNQNICAVIARVCNTTSWYTMCLPFEVKNVAETFGNNSKAATLDSFADNVFKFTSQTTIAANTPFILKPGRGTSELTTSQVSGKYTAYSVNGTKEEASSDPATTATGAKFTGVYKSGNVPDGSYFIGEGNKFYHASDATNKIDPFRAYLTIDSSEKSKSIGFEIDGETTDIRFINNQPVNVEDGVINDLSGRRVKNPSKGVYIMNNKKVIIK